MQFTGEEPRAQVEPFQLDCVTFLKIAKCVKWFFFLLSIGPKGLRATPIVPRFRFASMIEKFPSSQI